MTLATEASLAAITDARLAPTDVDGIARCDHDVVFHNDLAQSLGLTNLSYWGTTLSAGEYSGGAATTDDHGRKGAIIDPRLGSLVAINDPDMTSATPPLLWASSGMKCLDPAIEALYSAQGDSFTDALASHALRLLLAHVPGSLSTARAERMSRRGWCQRAACLSPTLPP